MDAWMKRALSVWSGVVALFGLGLCGAGLEATDGFARFAFGVLGAPDAVFTPELQFAVALMGAVTFGWGLTLLAVARSPAADMAVWRRIRTAALVWFVVDSGLSITTGFGLNALSNAVLTAALLLILARGGAARTELRRQEA